MTVQQALEQPAVISNSFRDSYYPHKVLGKLLAPAMLPQGVRDALAAKGHQLDVRDVKGVGSVKGIMIHPRTGVLMGGVSPGATGCSGRPNDEREKPDAHGANPSCPAPRDRKHDPPRPAGLPSSRRPLGAPS